MALSIEKATANVHLTKLLELIQLLKPLLEVLQQNHFAGVPAVRQYTIEEYLYPSRSRVPYLRIKGNWLAKSGFQPGQKVHIIPLQELLIVCPGKPVKGRGEHLTGIIPVNHQRKISMLNITDVQYNLNSQVKI